MTPIVPTLIARAGALMQAAVIKAAVRGGSADLLAQAQPAESAEKDGAFLKKRETDHQDHDLQVFP